MSIDAEIAKLNGTELTFLGHSIPSMAVVRDVFVGKEVLDLVGDEASPPSDVAKVAGRARAKLDTITGGGIFVFGMNPKHKSPTCLIARNSPPQMGVLDVRVSDPNPGLRIFGCLAQKDVLVLLTWARRKDLDFQGEIKRCSNEWTRLFPAFPAFFGNYATEYFTDVIPG